MVLVSWMVPFSPTRPPQAPAGHGGVTTTAAAASDGGGQAVGTTGDGHGVLLGWLTHLRRPPRTAWFPRSSRRPTIRRGLRDDDAARGARAPTSSWAAGPQYPWGGLYGGQIVAQGLRAGAAHGGGALPRALAARLLHPAGRRRRADPLRGHPLARRPLVLHPPRRRQPGRSGVILTMSLSFQVDEAGHDVQTARDADGARRPRSSSGYSWSPMFLRRFAAAPQRGGGPRGGVAEDARPGRRRPRPAGVRARLPLRRPAHRRRGRRPPRPARRPRRATPSSSAGCRPASTTPSGSTARRAADEWHIHDFTSPRLPVEPRPRHRPRPQPRRRPRRDRRPGGPAPQTR